MFLGFGAIFVTSWRELNAFPAKPLRVTVREAVVREEPGPGAWIELTDVRFPCDHESQGGYRLGFGATEDDRIIVSGTRPCSDEPVPVAGVLDTATPGRIAGLAFPGYDFERWPRAWQSTLWTANGPDDSRDSLLLMPPFALMGLVVFASFLKKPPPPVATLENVAGTVEPEPWRDDERVLPARPLTLVRTSLYDRVLTFLALLVMAWMMLVLGWFSFASMGGVLGVLGLVFFGLIGLALGALALRLPLQWSRTSPENGTLREGLALLEAQRPLQAAEVDELVVRFKHPLTRVPLERVIASHESRPLLVDGYLFVVWGARPEALIIVGQDFSPYDLTPTEQRESLRRLLRWVASTPRAA